MSIVKTTLAVAGVIVLAAVAIRTLEWIRDKLRELLVAIKWKLIGWKIRRELQ